MKSCSIGITKMPNPHTSQGLERSLDAAECNHLDQFAISAMRGLSDFINRAFAKHEQAQKRNEESTVVWGHCLRLTSSNAEQCLLPIKLFLLSILLLINLAVAPAWATPNPPTLSPDRGCFAIFCPMTMNGDTGTTIYYTTDGSTPTTSSPNSCAANSTVPIPPPTGGSGFVTVKAIEYSSPNSSTVTSVTLQFDPDTVNIPTAHLLLWLKSDNGVTLSGSNVSSWLDMSGVGNDASQANSAAQPTFSSSAVNGLPALTFDGTSSFLQLTGGLANLNLLSAFIVTKPTAAATNARLIEIGNGSSGDRFYLSQPTTNGLELFIESGTTPSSLTSSNGITLNQFQILEAFDDAYGNSSIRTNGTQGAQGVLNPLTNTTRSNNFIGTDYLNTLYFQGQIAEIFVFRDPLSAADRAHMEDYLINRYNIVGPAPTISPSSAVFPHPGGPAALPAPLMEPITITTPDHNAAIKYTLDGTTPTGSSTAYTGPFNVTGDCTVKAIATRSFGNSAVSQPAYIQIDQTGTSVARDGLVLWLKSDYGVFPSYGAKVSQWIDMSGSRQDAAQSISANQPTLAPCELNGHAAIHFNGLNQYFQLPSGFSDFTAGATALVVTKPSNTSSGTLLELSNGSTSDNIVLSSSSSTPSLTIYNSTTGSTLSATGAMTLGKFQLLEGTQDGNGNGFLIVNATPVATGGLTTARAITRSQNTVGAQFDGSANFFKGGIAEVLIYNRKLTHDELANAESYLLTKYQLLSITPDEPVIGMDTGIYQQPFDVSITAPSECNIFYTLDGTTPDTTKNPYFAPVRINYTQTLKAIAVRAGVSSAVNSRTYTLDSTQWPAPSGSDMTAPDFKLQLPTISIPQ